MTGKTAEAFLGICAVVVSVLVASGNGSLNLSSLAGTACTSGVPTQWYQDGDSLCASCVQKECATEKACLTNECAGYGQCLCACSVGDLTCYSSCQPYLSGQCTSCESTVSSCVVAHCSASCGDGGLAMSGRSGGGDGGKPSGICSTLATCCKTQTGVGQQVCNEVAANNDVSVCQAAYAGLLDAGSCK